MSISLLWNFGCNAVLYPPHTDHSAHPFLSFVFAHKHESVPDQGRDSWQHSMHVNTRPNVLNWYPPNVVVSMIPQLASCFSWGPVDGLHYTLNYWMMPLLLQVSNHGGCYCQHGQLAGCSIWAITILSGPCTYKIRHNQKNAKKQKNA